jgi:hypothetical protein
MSENDMKMLKRGNNGKNQRSEDRGQRAVDRPRTHARRIGSGRYCRRGSEGWGVKTNAK